MADESRWRLRRHDRVGDRIIGGVAGACARARLTRWVTDVETAEVEVLAREHGIDERLAVHLAPKALYSGMGGHVAFERVLGWMEWASERPEPERTQIIEAFEFYLGFGGDADFKLGGGPGR
jgi:hypothetical protein